MKLWFGTPFSRLKVQCPRTSNPDNHIPLAVRNALNVDEWTPLPVEIVGYEVASYFQRCYQEPTEYNVSRLVEKLACKYNRNVMEKPDLKRPVFFYALELSADIYRI
jgi:hypothetical protein